jgi:hypothetical protein
MTQIVAAVAAVICIAGALPVAAHAQSRPANPNGLGTSRILVVAPTDYVRLGTMHYPETLPLADKEVVLTFDDGPLLSVQGQLLLGPELGMGASTIMIHDQQGFSIRRFIVRPCGRGIIFVPAVAG